MNIRHISIIGPELARIASIRRASLAILLSIPITAGVIRGIPISELKGTFTSRYITQNSYFYERVILTYNILRILN
jgi:hypothetical protein